LGIFTFEMLFALPPFYNKNQDLMFKAISTANITFPA
jgi:serum/glucocorticoid-regulated kinase 2